MRLSVSSKVFLGFAAVIGTFGAVTLFGVREMHVVGQGLALVSQAYHPLTRLSAQLESSFRESEQATSRLHGEDDPRTRRALLALALDAPPRAAREKVRVAREVVARARELAPDRSESSFLDRVDGLLSATLVRYDAYARAGAEADALLDRLAQAPAADAPAVREQLDASLRRLKKVESSIAAGLADLSEEMEERIDLRVRVAGTDERRAAFLIVAFSLGAIAIGLLVTAASQRALAPIRRLTEAVKEVGEGRFAGEVAVSADDEMGVLARELNAMARKLAERERQLAEKNAELLRSERLAAVGRLAAQITHEIRNPLSSLSLNAELLQDQLGAGQDSGGEARSLVAAMAREVDRLVGITEEYLRFARLPKPSLGRLDLADAVEDLLDFMAPELAASGVKVERALAPDAPPVRADHAQVRQVLLNLVRNAREATGPGGSVRVRTRVLPAPDGRLRVGVEIEDDGPGIPPEVRERIFEPFFSTKERGTGLGLALVQQIVHEHGGKLSCDSAPGKGTRLLAAFPVFDEPATVPEGRLAAAL